MVKNIKCDSVIINKTFLTGKDISKNLFHIRFISKKFDVNKNELSGVYELNYNNLNYILSGTYELGSDIRDGLYDLLQEDLYINSEINNKNNKDNIKILVSILKTILPNYNF